MVITSEFEDGEGGHVSSLKSPAEFEYCGVLNEIWS